MSDNERVEVIDEDIAAMNQHRYETLVKTFGKEKADEMMGVSVDEKPIDDAELNEVIEGAGTLESETEES